MRLLGGDWDRRLRRLRGAPGPSSRGWRSVDQEVALTPAGRGPGPGPAAPRLRSKCLLLLSPHHSSLTDEDRAPPICSFNCVWAQCLGRRAASSSRLTPRDLRSNRRMGLGRGPFYPERGPQPGPWLLSPRDAASGCTLQSPVHSRLRGPGFRSLISQEGMGVEGSRHLAAGAEQGPSRGSAQTLAV